MTRPWPRTAVLTEGRLAAVGGMTPSALAAAFGTPLYVLDAVELVGRMRAYREAFGPRTDVVYAAKALCVTGVLGLAAQEGLAVDVASEGELSTAMHAGVPPSSIVMHGSNKTARELQLTAEHGFGRLVVDSVRELARADALGVERGLPLDILLRITPGVEARTHRFITTGQDDSKFGFTLSTGVAHEAVARALKLPGVALRGIHCHIGSQITTLAAFAEAASAMVELLADIRDRHGIELGELNLGGGLGIAQAADDVELDIADYATTIRSAVADACAQHGLVVPRLAVEPGRSIVGPAGITLYTVGTVKDLPGVRTYISVDGGMSDNPRPALYGTRYAFAAAGPRPSAPTRLVTVVGKHCESGDVLARDVLLPDDLDEGDLLAAAATGAYTYAMASNYNRAPRPAMVLVADGAARLLIRRESIDDLLRHDVPL